MFAVSFPAQILQQRQLEQTYAPVPGMLIHSPAVIPREAHLHEKLEAMDLNFVKKLTSFYDSATISSSTRQEDVQSSMGDVPPIHEMGQLGGAGVWL